MALGLLLSDPDPVHSHRHDLESVMWVLLWLCTFYGEPALACTGDQLARSRQDAEKVQLHLWGKWDVNACEGKFVYLVSPQWKQRYLRHVLPYWACWTKPDGLFSRLRELFAPLYVENPERKDVTYDEMLDALRVGHIAARDVDVVGQ